MSRAKPECAQCRDVETVVTAEGLVVLCGSNECSRRRQERAERRAFESMQAWIGARDRRLQAMGAKP